MTGRVRIVLIGAGLALVVAGAFAWFLSGGEVAKPATFRGEPTSALYSLIDSRERDTAPLTLTEVFGPATQQLGALTRAGTAELTDCADALDGVSAPGCTQVVRGAYTSAAVAGEFLIFNLPDGRAANALVAGLGKDGFVRQAAAFDAARSWAQVRAIGHFVTVSWVGPVGDAARPDLTQPQVALDGLGHVLQNRVVNAG